MKPLLFAAVIGTGFICALAFGDVNLNKIHKGMSKDGSKIDCAYCHKDSGIPKEGIDYKKHQKKTTCASKGCH